MVALSERYLGHLGGKASTRRAIAPHASGRSRTIRKRTEQVHFCLGGQGYSQQDDERYVLTIVDSVLGGSMSSRLFQEIREKRGLAYAIGSYSIAYQESGLFAIYGGTSPETFAQVVDLTLAEMEKVKHENLTPEEVQKAKTQIRGALVLSLESMSNRMMRMGKSMIYFGRVIPLEEIIGKINAVTREDIARVAHNIFDERNLSLAAVGPLGKSA
jgi:predicted Zn-dependent peptidase